MLSFLGWEGLGEADEPGLGTEDTSVAEAVGSETNKLAAPAAGVGADGSLKLIGLAAPPSVATVEIGTSGAGSTVIPPDAVTEHTLTHVFELVKENIISDDCLALN